MLHLNLYGLVKDILEGQFSLEVKSSVIKRSQIITQMASISSEAKEYETKGRTMRYGYMAFMTELTNLL